MEIRGTTRRLAAAAVAVLATAIGLSGIPGAGADPQPAAPAATGGAVPGQLLVSYRPGVSPAAVGGIERGLGATLVRTIDPIGVRVLRVPPAATGRVLAALAHDPAVAFAEQDQIAHAAMIPNDYWWPSQWSPVKTNAPKAWDVTTGSPSVVIAILDTGVSPSQPDLQGKLVAGRDIVNNDADPTDDHGHGTLVAGIAGAASNNSTGVASYCWGCSLMPVKVLGSAGSGTYSDIAAGITWATDHGARVVNMSLGGGNDSTSLSSAVRYAHDRGVVMVAAAGNSGTTSLNYPAAYPEVIGVAASDSTDALYTWSNNGQWVKVAAPGFNVTTARDGSYGEFAGTSSASPAVAGIAGLAASAMQGATNTQIEQAVFASAKPITGVAYGRVDAAGTLAALTGGSGGGSGGGGSGGGGTTSPPPATTTTTTFNGSLTPKTMSRSYDMTAGAGSVAAGLTFSKASSLTLALVAGDGTVVARALGASPVVLSASVAAGPYTLVVSGTERATFTITATYPVA